MAASRLFKIDYGWGAREEWSSSTRPMLSP